MFISALGLLEKIEVGEKVKGLEDIKLDLSSLR
jgi:hypothetical protein